MSRLPIGSIIEGFGRLINQFDDERPVHHKKPVAATNPVPTVRLFESAEQSKLTIVVQWDGPVDPTTLDSIGVTAFHTIKAMVTPQSIIPTPVVVPVANTPTSNV